MEAQTRREINLAYKFWLKYMLLVKQPRKCCGMDNLKYEEKSAIEVKISKSYSQKMLETMGIEKKNDKHIKIGLSDLKIKILF